MSLHRSRTPGWPPDKNHVSRPAFLQAGPDPDDFNREAGVLQALLEPAVLARRPHGQRALAT
jgi:hypothetical protein